MRIDKDIYDLKEDIIKHRRWFHKNPEIGFQVHNTRDYIIKKLEDLAFDNIELLAETGIKALMKGKIGNRTLAFRADMDALAIEEKTQLEFASQKKGYMHACGHDGHMAILLGFAEWLSQNKIKMDDNVVLIFQPNEEQDGGALSMIKEGLLDNPPVDVIFGFHIMPDIPQGKFGIKVGPLMAQTCEVDIEIMGKSAHGAMPHKGIDAIVAAGNFITSLQSLVARQIDWAEKIVFTIGRIFGGDTRNIIGDKVKMECTVRTFGDKAYKDIKSKVLNLLSGMELTYGIRSTYTERVYYPPVINDEGWTQRLLAILSKGKYIEASPLMIAEDFSYYQREVPGVFIFLGSGNEKDGYVHPLHSNRFDFDEHILLYGIQLYKDIIMKI